MFLAILAAGKPVYRERPSASEQVFADIPAAKWTMSAVNADTSNTQIVVGYEYEEVQQALPGVTLIMNPDWQTCGSVGSFCKLNLGDIDSLIVCYSDIVFSRRLVEDLENQKADVVVVWDSQFLSRVPDGVHGLERISVEGASVLASGSAAHSLPGAGFFPGVVKFSPKALAMIQEMPPAEKERLSSFHLSELVEFLRQSGAKVCAVGCEGQWARVEEPDELVRFILRSKADTLVRLRPLLTKSEIPQSMVFEVREWLTQKRDILLKIDKRWPGQELVIRSSARAEDSFEESMAGAFLSIIGAPGKHSVEEAIDLVIESYPDDKPENQVLVQARVQELIANGVAFTRSLGADAPWLSINFELSDRSDGITSGKSSTSRTLNIFRPSSESWVERAKHSALMEKLPVWIPALLEAIHELEAITHYSRLDIEFAIDSDGRIHIFQVRPLASTPNLDAPSDEEFEEVLERSKLHFDSSESRVSSQSDNQLFILSNMTDWNPAEILGAAPGQLAISLYEELITNDIWSDSRAYFGYRELSNRPLLENIAGRPYVDVSASIESLLPAGLAEEDSKALLGFFLSCLDEHPELHDKLEFDVVPTCLTPNFSKWSQRLIDSGNFGEQLVRDYEGTLRDITRNAIQSIHQDFELLKDLDGRFDEVLRNSRLHRAHQIERTLSICKEFGTFPFSNLARRAFVAVTLLRDAAEAGVISRAAVDSFLSSIRSVSHIIGSDAAAVRAEAMSWDTFVANYGHLRPGTYDITSPRYDSNPDVFLRPLLDSERKADGDNLNDSPWNDERGELFNWIRREIHEFDDDQIENFLRDAIEGRESAKFAFTRLLSWVLEELKEYADDWGVSVEEISHLRFDEILRVARESSDSEAPRQRIASLVSANLKDHRLASLIKLPGFISSSEDLFVFLTGYDIPNFVGTTRVLEKSTYIKPRAATDSCGLLGKIILIEAADPGFDWIFGHGITGLVTKFGGANSHMAIRAAEFGLPAAIGVGETLFDTLRQAETVELDPGNQILRGL